MVSVSVLILARNEHQNIEDCIKSCLSFAQEVIVIDDNSTDDTKELAEAQGAKVITHAMNGDWGAQQTFAIQQAACPWIFFIDADERCTPELAAAIEKYVVLDDKVAYCHGRRNLFHFNKADHGVLRPDNVIRLMPKEGSYVEGRVHPAIVTPYPVKVIPEFIYHYTYDNWQQYFGKFNNYTDLAARKMLEKGKHASVFKDIVLRPIWAFIKVYFLNGGFLDGRLGWVLSCNHFMYTMMKYERLYDLEKSNGKL